MAGFLQFLPSLLSSAASNEGLIGSLKNAVGNVFSDIGEGKVGSGADFGKSLARGAATLLGHKSNAADTINSQMANAETRNVADRMPIAMEPSSQYDFAIARQADPRWTQAPSIVEPAREQRTVRQIENVQSVSPGLEHQEIKRVYVASRKRKDKNRDKKRKPKSK